MIERAVESLDTLIAEGRRFACIYADPPWRYDNRASRGAAEDHYGTMAVEDIARLPVEALAAERCHLHLWTTNAFLWPALRILEAWGFVYRDCFVWVKPTMGCGNWWRVSHEYLVLGVRGALPFLVNDVPSVMGHPRGRHSSKPDRIRRLVERVSPGPRLELFARGTTPGWVSWGNEIERTLFNGGAFAATARRRT